MSQLVHPKEKVSSAFLAAALGDAVGWPHEAPRKGASNKPGVWLRFLGSRFSPIPEEVRNGDYSDDTQLILAATRSILKQGSNWADYFYFRELPAWRLYERGGGRATKVSAEKLADGILPWAPTNNTDFLRGYFAAGGNGGAMRILPHVAFRLVNEGGVPSLAKDVLTNCIATHGHPRALVGALAHAFTLRFAFSKTDTLGYGELLQKLLNAQKSLSFDACVDALDPSWLDSATKFVGGSVRVAAEWDQTAQEVSDMVEMGLTEMARGALASELDFLRKIGALSKASNGAGTVSAVAGAFLASRYATDPMAGLEIAGRIPGLDSDTVASMAGSLLAAINGAGWMTAGLSTLQDSDYIRRVASNLAVSAEESKAWQTKFANSTAQGFSMPESLQDPTTGLRVTDDTLGDVEVEKVSVLMDKKQKAALRVTRALAFGGQRVYFYGSYKKGKTTTIPDSDPSVDEGGVKVGIRFYTRRLDIIRDFYERVLDWKPGRVTTSSVVYQPNIVFADLRGGEMDLFLTEPGSGQSLLIEVKNLGNFRNKLKERDVKIVVDELLPRKSLRPMVVLHDPEGRRIEVYARDADKPQKTKNRPLA